LSIRSNSRGNASHRLKQRRQVWQMSKIRCISASVFARSVKSGSSHAIACRVGASRLPSLIVVLSSAYKRAQKPFVSAPLLYRGGAAGSEGVERLLEAAGVRLLRLCKRLEPLGDFLEALLASRSAHSRIHIRIFVCFAGNGGA